MSRYLLLIVALMGAILTEAKEYSLLIPTKAKPNQMLWVNELSEFTLLKADERVIGKIIAEKPKSFDLVIPGERALHLHLIAHNPYADGFVPEIVGKAKVMPTKFNAGVHFRGTIKEYPNSQLGLSVWGNEVFMVAFGGGINGNLVLGRLGSRKDKEAPIHILYNDHDLSAKNPFSCGSHAGMEKKDWQALSQAKNRVFPPVGAPTTCKAVRKYMEVDYTMYQDFGMDTSAAINFTAAMFSVTQILYENENTKAVIKRVKVWTVPDTFNYNNGSRSVLDQFANAMSRGFDGDLAHLLTTVNAGLGGIAYVGVLCLGDPYYQTAFSNIDITYNSLPTYSWTVNVVAHEMGHNFGSRHTQNCGWDLGNGISGMLDSCFTPEGNCYTGPRIGTVGTIMSYCHITGRVDLALGFGPQPGAVVKEGFDSATCLGNGIIIAPVAVTTPMAICAGTATQLSVSKRLGANYIWEGPSGFTQTTTDSFLVIPSFNSNQFGEWFVTIDLNGCKTTPKNFALNNECFKVVGHTAQSCEGSGINIKISTAYSGSNQYYIGLLSSTGNFIKLDSAVNTPIYNRTLQLPVSVSPGNYRIEVKEPQFLLGDTSETYLAVLDKPSTLQGSNLSFCTPRSFKLGTAPTNFTHQWFDSSGVLVFEGDSFTTPVINNNNRFSLRRKQNESLRVGPRNTGPQFAGSYLANVDRGNYIKVFRSITIKEAWVDAQSGGWIVAIVKDRNTLREVDRDSVWLDFNGWQNIPLNLKVPAGDFLLTASGSTVTGLYRNNAGGLNYPYEIPGVMQITGSNAEPSTSFYYYFYDLKVDFESCLSDPAVFNIAPISTLAAPSIQVQGNLNFCQGDSVVLTVNNPNNNTVEWNNNVRANSLVIKNQGTFSARFLDGNCNSPYSTTYNVVVSPKPNTPIINVIGNNACQGSRVTLEAPTGFLYLWSNGQTSQTLTFDTAATITLRTISLSANGTSCTSQVSAPVQVMFKTKDSVAKKAEICSGSTFAFGNNILTTSGNYRRTLTNRFGCDSTISLALKVNQLPAFGSVNQIADTLWANVGRQPIDSIIWFLNGNFWRASANRNLVLTPTDTGLVTIVLVDTNGCVSTLSNPYRISRLSAVNEALANSFELYPNPSLGLIQVKGLRTGTPVSIINNLGQPVWQGKIEENQFLNLSQLPAGVYQLIAQNRRKSLIIVKE